MVWEGFFRHILVATGSLMCLFYQHDIFQTIFNPHDGETPPATTAQYPSWLPIPTAFFPETPMKLDEGDRFCPKWNRGKSPDVNSHFRKCRLLPPTGIATAEDRGRLWVVGKRLGEVSTVVSVAASHTPDTMPIVTYLKVWAAVEEISGAAGNHEAFAALLARFSYAGDMARLINSGDSGDADEDELIGTKLVTWPRVILAGDVQALAPANCRSGDVVVLLDGAPLEAILRPVGHDTFQLVGRAVVAGMTPDSWKCFETGSLEDLSSFV